MNENKTKCSSDNNNDTNGSKGFYFLKCVKNELKKRTKREKLIQFVFACNFR